MHKNREMFHIILFVATLCGFTSSENITKTPKNMLGGQFYDGRKIVVPLAENASVQLLNHWIQQAAGGFLAAFAKKRVEKLSPQNKKRFQQCSKLAHSVNKHAICIVDLLKLENRRRGSSARTTSGKSKWPKRHPSTAKFKMLGQHPRIHSKRKLKSKKERWIGAFHVVRAKRTIERRKGNRKIVNRDGYQITTEKDAKTAVGVIMRGVKKIFEKLKQKKTSKPWPVMIAEMRQLALELQKRKQLLDALKNRAANGFNMSHPQARLGNPERTFQKRRTLIAPPISKLFRNGVLLGLSMVHQNISTMRNKTIRMASPRFLSLSPDVNRQDEVNLFSPSILSLHNEGEDLERKFSIPELLETFNLMNQQDQNELLELIFETSGLSDAMQKIHKDLQTSDDVLRARGIDGQPLYFTKQNVTQLYGKMEEHKINTFEKLYKTLTKRQIAELNATGYAVLDKKQLELIYGHRSPYQHPIALERLSKLLDHRGALRKSLESDLKKLTESENFGLNPKKLHRRQKRFGVVLSPFVLAPFILAPGVVSQPIILSPLVMSPVILSPAVFGPFILSPWVFNPLILSPRVLSPFIVSPLIFTPIVLSPLVLHPFILAPGVFNPFVLSPMVLSPFILSPQVATPFILTPMVLNPLILTPMALSPLVLSPFALSPLVYSPQYLFALVLSPYILSPQIESKLIQSTVILSPSALS